MTYPDTPGFQKHSETSRNAAKTLNADTLRKTVLKYIVDAGEYGSIGDEIAEHFNIAPGTVSARLIELERWGYIVKLTRTRKTRRGKPANVYTIPRFAGAGDVIKYKPKNLCVETGERKDVIEWFVKQACAGELPNGCANIHLTPIEVCILKRIAQEAGIPWRK